MHAFETRGIEFRCASEHELSTTRQKTEQHLRRHHLLDAVKVVEKKEGANVVLTFFLSEESKGEEMPFIPALSSITLKKKPTKLTGKNPSILNMIT